MEGTAEEKNVDEVETVEVQLDRLRVLANLSRRKHDWDFELGRHVWHEHLTRHDWEIEVGLLLEVRLKRDCLCVQIRDLEDLLDWRGLGRDEALAEVKHVGIELDSRLGVGGSVRKRGNSASSPDF